MGKGASIFTSLQLIDTVVLQLLSEYTSTQRQGHNCCLSLSEESKKV